MKSTTKILAALAVVSVSAFAQSEQVVATENEGSGLIGKRYAAAGLGYIDVRHSSYNAFAAGAEYNIPVNQNIDVLTSFSHTWGEGNEMNTVQDLNVTAVSYLTQGAVKPFVTVGLGYAWTSFNDEGLNYNVGVGGEYLLCKRASLTASVDFSDGFRRRTQSDLEFSATVGVNYWASKNVVLKGDITLIETGHLGYTLSAGYRF